MNLLRSVARACTGSIYVLAGSKTLQAPGPSTQQAAPLLEAARGAIPIAAGNEQLVQVNAGVQTVAGATLALGILPRLSAITLIGSLVPTTLAGHAFWDIEDPGQRAAQQIQFVKNLSMLGGLLYIASSGKS